MIRGKSIWCWLGLHRWDYPGGFCADCGARDDLFDIYPED